MMSWPLGSTFIYIPINIAIVVLFAFTLVIFCFKMSSGYKSQRSKDERVVITWKNLNFQTVIKDGDKSKPFQPVYKTKVILDNLHGRAESGQLLAILGPTGCGKTSLLNILAARIPHGGSAASRLTGEIRMNGKPRDETKSRSISAYVLQDDFMYAYLTVFETLLMAAHFFLPVSMSLQEKEEHVRSVIAELGLVKASDTIIGNDKVRGVSGGERRRASIAVQLLTDPAVLFLDEPTSGLDAFQSQAVMESMKKLADDGRLVISVIHQPRSSIYEMFNKLLVLSEGRTMFYGDAIDAVKHFQSCGFTCPDDFNPSDFFLDLLSPDNRTSEARVETRNRIKLLGDRWEEKVSNQEEVVEDISSQFISVKSIGTDEGFEKTFKAFQLLCWRCWVEQSRNKGAIIGKFVTAILFSLIIGGIYSKDTRSQQGIQNMKGILFFLLINQTFNSVLAVLNSFPREKLIVNRERDGRAYSTLSYCLAKFFVEMPLNLIPVVVYCCIVHPLADMNKDTFGQFIAICMFVNSVGVALGLAISSFAPNVDAANAVGPVFIIIGILFGGFYIKVSSLPIVLNWIPFLSLFRWGFQALCINEFKGRTYECNTSPNLCLLTGEEVLETLSYNDHTVRYPLFGLGMLLVGFFCALYVLLLLNKLTYTPLGHVGSFYAQKADPSLRNDVSQSQAQPSYAVVAQGEEERLSDSKAAVKVVQNDEDKKEVELV